MSQAGIGIVIIVASLVVAAGLYYLRPSPEKAKPATRATLVEALHVVKGPRALEVAAFGTVRPHRELALQVEVKGKVIELSKELDAGGILDKGEIMLKLDPRDYVAAVEQDRAKVEKAEFELIVEKGRKLVAEREWQLLDDSLKQGGLGKDLALRIPHLREKEAALQGTRSSLEKSLVDLKRTVIRAPFNALVIDEFVEVGQILSPQTKVATIVSTDEFRVQVSLPYDQLEWIRMPTDLKEHPVKVAILQDIGDGEVITRQGRVLRYLGDLDPNGRMVQLIIVIDDPLNLEDKESTIPPLLIGTYVEVLFQGPTMDNVIEIPRIAVRENKTVWVINQEGKLEIRKVEILSGDKQNVIIESGLEDGDKVVISNLTVAIPGMELKDLSEVLQEDSSNNE